MITTYQIDMGDAIVTGQDDVDNQQPVDCTSDIPDALTKQLHCDETYAAVVSEIGKWNGRVVEEMMERNGQHGDVNRSEHEIDQDAEPGLNVSRSLSISSDKNNVQIVKPLTTQDRCKVIDNVTNLAKGPKAIDTKLVELKTVCDKFDDTQYDTPESSQCDSDPAQLLRTVSQDWVADATSHELHEFAVAEVNYARPYEGRSYVVDQTLIRRSVKRAWRGQSVTRFEPAEIARHRATEDEDYLREVLTCECGVELEATRAAFRAADPHWQIRNGSARDLIHRLNAHEHHTLVEHGLIVGSAELSLGDKVKLAPVRPSPPVETVQPEVINDDVTRRSLLKSDVSNDVTMMEDVHNDELADDTADSCTKSVKRWLEQMDVVEQEFGGKCTESTEILETLEAYRTERLADIARRDENAQKWERPMIEYRQPDHSSCDEIGYFQPPRWHGHMSWRAFWNAFLNWSQQHRMDESNRGDFLRQALGGPVENLLTETFGPGRWVYAHVVGALHDRCRRLAIGTDHVTPADFVRGPMRVESMPDEGQTVWRQYTETMFKWCQELDMGRYERSYFLWRQFSEPLGKHRIRLTDDAIRERVNTFEEIHCLRRGERAKPIIYSESRMRAKLNALPRYDEATTDWDTFINAFGIWCDDRKCGNCAVTQYLRRALKGQTADRVMTVVGVDSLVYRHLIERIKSDSDAAGTKHEPWSNTDGISKGKDNLKRLEMPCFFGRDWAGFIKKFEAACRIYLLGDEARAHYLRRAMVGSVATDVGSICGVDYWTYSRLRYELEFRYDDAAVLTPRGEETLYRRIPGGYRMEPGVCANLKETSGGNSASINLTQHVMPTLPTQGGKRRFSDGDDSGSFGPRQCSPLVEHNAHLRTRRFVQTSLWNVRARMGEVLKRSEALEKKVNDLQQTHDSCPSQDGELRVKSKNGSRMKGRRMRQRQARNNEPAVVLAAE